MPALLCYSQWEKSGALCLAVCLITTIVITTINILSDHIAAIIAHDAMAMAYDEAKRTM